jgi:hypothetical protein
MKYTVRTVKDPIDILYTLFYYWCKCYRHDVYHKCDGPKPNDLKIAHKQSVHRTQANIGAQQNLFLKFLFQSLRGHEFHRYRYPTNDM